MSRRFHLYTHDARRAFYRHLRGETHAPRCIISCPLSDRILAHDRGSSRLLSKRSSRFASSIARIQSGLTSQQSLLQIRDLSLAPELLEHVAQVDVELTALDKALRSDETELEQLRALTETSALINSSLDPDAILAQAMDEIINLTGAERGYILLRNKNSAELEFRVCREPENDARQRRGHQPHHPQPDFQQRASRS